MTNKILLIGHRGAGKSSLLRRLEASGQFSGWRFISLDLEMEQRQGASIRQIFDQKGEAGFRILERETLGQLVNDLRGTPHMIDLGAGFSGDKPLDYKAVWIRRGVDLSRSQFTDRPNLDGGLQISAERFAKREALYQEMADYHWQLLEGDDLGVRGDVPFFKYLAEASPIQVSSSWHQTVLHANHAQTLLANSKPAWRLEWRDDLVAENWLSRACDMGWVDLLSFRQSPVQVKPHLLQKVVAWDWPIEWGGNSEAPWLSLHTRKDQLAETLLNLPQLHKGQKIKLALPIETWAELRDLWQWQQEDPTCRVALPMSSTGRWAWFRLLTGGSSPLAFFSFAKGSAPDQPTLNQVLQLPERMQGFAAVLGSPVVHSHTPTFHADFFRTRNRATFAIDIKDFEFSEAWPVVTQLGLSHAAVTSPLKHKAAQLLGVPGTLNTLFVGTKLQGTNTDAVAFAWLLKQVSSQTAIWGGGGVLAPLQELRPEIACYSSRTGQLKQGQATTQPQDLIWAVGAGSFAEQGCWPPRKWRPVTVFDLNYTLDSPAIAWAHQQGVAYQSGLEFFKIQARAQQTYWDDVESQLK